MADVTRRAEVIWRGGLRDGSGSFTVGSGALPADQPVSWAARTEAPDGQTSPEELIASAHASCYAMALSGVLARDQHEPEQLSVTAVVTFAPKDGGGFHISKSDLTVRGRVPGLEQERFAELAREGEAGCPVSNALRGNVEISLDAAVVS